MESTRGFPLWAWWTIGIAVIIGIVAGVVLAISNPAPVLPPGLVEKREAVTLLLETQRRLEDTDIKPLIGLEARRDYRGAVALMEKALEANTRHEQIVGELAAVSGELAGLAVRVEPNVTSVKAVAAFGTLGELAKTEKQFYANRRRLYEITRNYYADLDAQKTPPISGDLEALVDTVNADLEKAQQLSRQFAAAVQAFDEAVAGR